MKRKTAIVMICLSLTFIAAMIVASVHSMSSNSSADSQHARMYLVFAAYIVLLLAVRALAKTSQASVSTAGWAKGMKVIIGSVAVSGAFFLCGVVLAVVIGGSEAVETVIPKLLYAVPAIAIVSAPFLIKRMS